jgi:hypothetical protein
LAPGRERSARSISSTSRSSGRNRRWIKNRFSSTVSATANPRTSAASGFSLKLMSGFAARIAATTATTISNRLTTSTWVSSLRSRMP